MTNLDILRRVRDGQGMPVGWRQTLGARLAEVEAGRVVVELDASARHRHEAGVVQGGVITQIADAAMGMTLMTVQEEGWENTTIELKINFFRPVFEDTIRALGRIVQMRSSLMFAEADVTDSQGRLIAHSTCTCMAIRRADGGR